MLTFVKQTEFAIYEWLCTALVRMKQPSRWGAEPVKVAGHMIVGLYTVLYNRASQTFGSAICFKKGFSMLPLMDSRYQGFSAGSAPLGVKERCSGDHEQRSWLNSSAVILQNASATILIIRQ